LRFCPEAIICASEFTYSSRLSLNHLNLCHSLAYPNKSSTHTAPKRIAERLGASYKPQLQDSGIRFLSEAKLNC
jgi:hypothetical protein